MEGDARMSSFGINSLKELLRVSGNSQSVDGLSTLDVNSLNELFCSAQQQPQSCVARIFFTLKTFPCTSHLDGEVSFEVKLKLIAFASVVVLWAPSLFFDLSNLGGFIFRSPLSVCGN